MDVISEDNSQRDQDSTDDDISVAGHQDELDLPPADEDDETELVLENKATNPGMYPQPFRGGESLLPRKWCWWHQIHVGSTNNHPQC
jgi:hypothetical protein